MKKKLLVWTVEEWNYDDLINTEVYILECPDGFDFKTAWITYIENTGDYEKYSEGEFYYKKDKYHNVLSWENAKDNPEGWIEFFDWLEVYLDCKLLDYERLANE